MCCLAWSLEQWFYACACYINKKFECKNEDFSIAYQTQTVSWATQYIWVVHCFNENQN